MGSDDIALTLAEPGVTWPPPGMTAAQVAGAVRAGFVFVDALAPGATEQVAEAHRSRAAAFWAVPGPVGLVARQRGWSDVLRRSVRDPAGLEAELRGAVAQGAAVVEAGRAADADALVVADDVAGAAGWLLDPAFVRDVVVPLEGSLARGVWSPAVPVVFHSDGDVREVYPALARAGFTGVHLAPSAPGNFDALCSAAWTAELAVMGGIAAATLGVRQSEEIAREALGRSTVAICDDGGLTDFAQVDALAQVYGLMRTMREAGD